MTLSPCSANIDESLERRKSPEDNRKKGEYHQVTQPRVVERQGTTSPINSNITPPVMARTRATTSTFSRFMVEWRSESLSSVNRRIDLWRATSGWRHRHMMVQINLSQERPRTPLLGDGL